MNPRKLILWPSVLLLGQMFTSPSFAEPTLYPKDLSVLSKIMNTTNSNLVADEVDSQTVWVMPPNTAAAVVSGLHTKTSNLGFCAEMGDLQSYSRELSADIQDLMRKKKAKFQELDQLQKKASLLDEEAQKYAADKNLTALSDLDTRISSAESRLSELYKASETCTKDCEKISEEVDSLNSAKNQMLIDRNKLAKSNTEEVKIYNQKAKVAQAAQKAYLNARGLFTDLSSELQGIQSKFKETYLSYGKMEGARASIKYLSAWDSNIAQLRQENPSINFSKMKTQNAQLMTAISGLGAVDSEGAIKSIEVGGALKSGVAEYPVYPESLSTNVVLSLIGACPMEHPEYFDLSSNSSQQMSYGVIITYDYQTVFKMKATASYNMYKMYQKIVSSGSSGGLFSSRSWSAVEERNFFSDTFNVVWNDKENVVSAEEKAAREAEMRKAVLLRLATLALPDSPSKTEILAAVAPPPHGAVVLADALVKTCPTNIYCQGGAIVLSVLDAIFGNSSSAASYTRINTADIVENYENTQKITKSWITSYL